MSSIIQENETNTNTVQKKKEIDPKLSLTFKIFLAEGELFSYKTDNVLTINHSTSNKYYYYSKQQGKNIIVNNEKHTSIQSNCEILFKARKSKNGYYELINPIHRGDVLDLDIIENLNKKMWRVLPSEKGATKYEEQNEPYNLQENDIIKIGLIQYEIIEKNITIDSKEKISSKNKNNLNDERIFSEEIENIIVYESTDEYNTNEINCRYCLTSSSSKEKPLLKLCKCNAFIHLDCLKLFLGKKVIIKEKNKVTSYICKNFNCEVCQKPYPLKFKYKETIYNLYDYRKPPKETNYIIFESLSYNNAHDGKDKNNIKRIHVVELTGNDITIGRNETNDIIDSDQTVSRYHGILKFNQENGFVTLTNKGTFGILVLIKNNLKIDIGQKVFIQVGKTYIKAEVSENENKEENELKYEKIQSNEELNYDSNNDSNVTTERSQSDNTMNINV